MKKQKLQEKLKLWDNPAFLEFLEDFNNLEDNPLDIKQGARMLKGSYGIDLAKIEEKESKYKQGNLGL